MQSSFSYQDWSQLTTQISPRTQAFIDGQYTDAQSGKTFPSINPANGQELAQITQCSHEDVDIAVKAARTAFESGSWSNMAPVQRKQIMIRFAELIHENLNELALLETLDMGKPIADSTSIDIPGAARTIAWYGEAIDKINDEIAPTAPDALGMITREPVGVVAAVVPWNFPLLMAAWKVGPALATGNSVVLKPSEKSPLTALRIAELAVQAGIPEGVLNVVPGFGDAGQALADHMDVDCIAFTGSTKVGKLIMQSAGASNLKRTWLECGGKSPNIVLADCPDLDKAAHAAAWGIFFNQGEMCTAASRLVVEESIKEKFLEKVIAVGQSLQQGDPIDPTTEIGALVDDKQLNTVMGYIESAKMDGAVVRLGGNQVLQETGGYYVAPTIFDNVSQKMTIAREEIFGPVLSTLTFNSLEQAVAIANASDYGLAAAVWTRDVTKAHSIARSLRAGTVWVNCYDEGDLTVPFGGYKQSGIGRDKSLHALDKYTELKTTWINLS